MVVACICLFTAGCCVCSCRWAEQWYRYEYVGDERKPRKAGRASQGGAAGGYVAYATPAMFRDKDYGRAVPSVPAGGYVAYVPRPLATRGKERGRAEPLMPAAPLVPAGGCAAYVPPVAAPLAGLAALSTDALERELARRKAEAV